MKVWKRACEKYGCCQHSYAALLLGVESIWFACHFETLRSVHVLSMGGLGSFLSSYDGSLFRNSIFGFSGWALGVQAAVIATTADIGSQDLVKLASVSLEHFVTGTIDIIAPMVSCGVFKGTHVTSCFLITCCGMVAILEAVLAKCSRGDLP